VDFSGVEELSVDECWELLANASSHQVGRVALVTNGDVLVLPVGFGVDDRTVVLRTHEGRISAQAKAAKQITFEADAGHLVHGSGWSVLLIGQPEIVTDAVSISRMRQHPPYAWGSKNTWIKIHPTQVSGRRVVWPHALSERCHRRPTAGGAGSKDAPAIGEQTQ